MKKFSARYQTELCKLQFAESISSYLRDHALAKGWLKTRKIRTRTGPVEDGWTDKAWAKAKAWLAGQGNDQGLQKDQGQQFGVLQRFRSRAGQHRG